MPPRHTYWTIIFGGQPTAFRSSTREELLPTFKQILARHPDALMRWFARGKLWASEEEAREAMMRARRPPAPPAGRAPGGWKDRPPRQDWRDSNRDPRPPKGPAGDRRRPSDRPPQPAWRDRDRDRNRDARPHRPPHGGQPGPRTDRPPQDRWRDRDRDRPPRPHTPAPTDRQPQDRRRPGPGWKDRPPDDRRNRSEGGGSQTPKPPAKDRWRSRPAGSAGADRRGRDWRPGGEHKDPRDRFKVPRDVKRARFKDKLRRDRTHPKPPKKKDDE